MYSLGFAPNPNWSRTYAPQAEIRQYLEDVAYKFEIVNQIKLNTEVTHAEWNNGLNRWLISTRDGKNIVQKSLYLRQVLLVKQNAELPGQEKFKGTMFHSGKWNHEHDLTGEKVAVIGSGASAIQFYQPFSLKLAIFIVSNVRLHGFYQNRTLPFQIL